MKPATVCLHLRPEPGWSHDENRRLAAALKALLRSYGWRCVKVEDIIATNTDAPDVRQGHADGAGGTNDD